MTTAVNVSIKMPKTKNDLNGTISSGGRKPIKYRVWKKAPPKYMNIKAAIGQGFLVYMKMILNEARTTHPGITKSARLRPQKRL
jgi:hypothetical protein